MEGICPFCQGDFKDDDIKHVSKCNHTFHQKCIDEYKSQHVGLKCPLCREDWSPSPPPPAPWPLWTLHNRPYRPVFQTDLNGEFDIGRVFGFGLEELQRTTVYVVPNGFLPQSRERRELTRYNVMNYRWI